MKLPEPVAGVLLGLLFALPAVVSFAAPQPVPTSPPLASSIGECIGRTTRTSIWVGQPASQRLYGALDPTSPYRPFLDGAVEYERRYGRGSWAKKGTAPGERVSLDFALAVFASAADSPCRLPAGYVPTPLDLEDAKLAAYGPGAWWDRWLMPRYRMLGEGPGPGCPACPTCPPAKPCPPSPPAACFEVYVPEQRTLYRPGLASTGVLSVRYEILPKECP